MSAIPWYSLKDNGQSYITTLVNVTIIYKLDTKHKQSNEHLKAALPDNLLMAYGLLWLS